MSDGAPNPKPIPPEVRALLDEHAALVERLLGVAGTGQTVQVLAFSLTRLTKEGGALQILHPPSGSYVLSYRGRMAFPLSVSVRRLLDRILPATLTANSNTVGDA